MKTGIFILCLVAGNSLFAQNTIFAGKITDSKGKAIEGAHIYIGGGGGDVKADAKSDVHGLFHTRDVPAGNYHIIVDVNGKTRGDGGVNIVNIRGEKRYYLLWLNEKGMSITTTDKNLFMEAKLDSIRKSPHNIDVPPAKQQYNTPTKDARHFIVPKEKQHEKK